MLKVLGAFAVGRSQYHRLVDVAGEFTPMESRERR